jgi:hypothetical protein
MDLIFYPGNYVIECIQPFLATMTGAKGLVFGFCQQPDDVLSLGPHPRVVGSNCAGGNYVL